MQYSTVAILDDAAALLERVGAEKGTVLRRGRLGFPIALHELLVLRGCVDASKLLLRHFQVAADFAG